jgi:hypothetical protein
MIFDISQSLGFNLISTLYFEDKILIASTHLAIGAVSGLAVQRYLPESCGIVERLGAGITVGVLSHILMDAVPHQDYNLHGYGLGALLFVEVSLVLFFIFYPPQITVMNLIIFSAMIGSASPDLLGMTYRHIVKLEEIRIMDNILHTYHGKIPLGFKIGILWQLLIAMLLIVIVKFKSA